MMGNNKKLTQTLANMNINIQDKEEFKMYESNDDQVDLLGEDGDGDEGNIGMINFNKQLNN